MILCIFSILLKWTLSHCACCAIKPDTLQAKQMLSMHAALVWQCIFHVKSLSWNKSLGVSNVPWLYFPSYQGHIEIGFKYWIKLMFLKDRDHSLLNVFCFPTPCNITFYAMKCKHSCIHLCTKVLAAVYKHLWTIWLRNSTSEGLSIPLKT